jgi:hypothetical protein
MGLAGAPVSAVNWALEATGVKKPGEPVGGMQQVTRGWEELLGVKHTKVPTDLYGKVSKSNEYIGKIAEFLGGSLFPGAGAVANASRKLLTAVTLTTSAVSGATTAVELKEAGGRLAPQFGLTKEQGEQIGEIAGGFAGPGLVGAAGQGVAKSLSAGGKALNAVGVTGISPEAQKAAASGLLRKEILTSLEHAPQSEANVARAIELKKKMDNFSPNLAQMTNAPGAIATYKEIANKSPEALAKAAEAERRNLAAIESYKGKVFGASPAGGGQALTDPAKIKLTADRDVIQMELDKTQRDLRALSDNYRRTVDNEAVGEELRALYWENRGIAKRQLDTELAGVYGTAKKFGIVDDMTDIRDSVKKIVSADRTTFQDMPPTFAKILQEYPEGTPDTSLRKAVLAPGSIKPTYRVETVKGQPGKSEASFEEMHSLYKQANKDWMDAVVSGNGPKAFYMKGVRDQLQQKIDKYQDPKYGELAQKFSSWNSHYTKYAQVFKEGAGGELAKRTRKGLATDSEDIVRKVFLEAGDKKKGIQDFFSIYGQNERAAELLHDGLLDNYAKAAMKSGTFNPVAARNWLAAHHSAMSELPETNKFFTNAQKAAEAMVNRKLELQQQRKVLDRSELAKVAGNEQPERLINRAIADPKIMRAVMEGAYTEESKQAIARAIADNISKRSDGLEFLKKNEASLKPVMETLRKGHWQNLLDIAEAESIVARTKAPTAVELAKLQDVGEQYIGTSIKGLFSRLRNLDKPMGVSKEYLVLDVAGRYFYKVRSEELARLREAAYFDADVAEVLAGLSKKSQYTQKDLLKLQDISYAAGVNSTAQGLAASRGEDGKDSSRK